MTKQINEILGVKESYKAPERMLEIVLDKEQLKTVGKLMLELHKNKKDYDWFHEYFQSEHADRKHKKQDFTPPAVADILAGITQTRQGLIYEPAAGTGGVIVRQWARATYKVNNPMERLYILEELSSRAIPFLLFNMAVRGINAVVVECDVLSRKASNFYHVFNIDNNPDDISDVIRLDPKVGKARMEQITNFKYELME